MILFQDINHGRQPVDEFLRERSPICLRSILATLEDRRTRNEDTMGVSPWRFIMSAGNLKYLFPDYQVSPNLKQRILEYFESMEIPQKDKPNFNNNFRHFVRIAAAIKILFPEERRIASRIPWNQAKEYERFAELPDVALGLKILAADEIKITAQDVKIIMKKPRADFQSAMPSLPEIKKF